MTSLNGLEAATQARQLQEFPTSRIAEDGTVYVYDEANQEWDVLNHRSTQKGPKVTLKDRVGENSSVFVKDLVAEGYLETYDKREEVLHIDGNVNNVHASNLTQFAPQAEWAEEIVSPEINEARENVQEF